MKSNISLSGRAWVFGDDIDTDVLAPGIYMKRPIEEMASHCLEAVAPQFATSVTPGDIVVAGENFGIGSSREQAAQALQVLGIAAIVARSFGGIFYRNAINFGLMCVTYRGSHNINTGDKLRVDGLAGRIDNLANQTSLACEKVPDHLMEIISAGGLVDYLEHRLAAQKDSARKTV